MLTRLPAKLAKERPPIRSWKKELRVYTASDANWLNYLNLSVSKMLQIKNKYGFFKFKFWPKAFKMNFSEHFTTTSMMTQLLLIKNCKISIYEWLFCRQLQQSYCSLILVGMAANFLTVPQSITKASKINFPNNSQMLHHWQPTSLIFIGSGKTCVGIREWLFCCQGPTDGAQFGASSHPHPAVYLWGSRLARVLLVYAARTISKLAKSSGFFPSGWQLFEMFFFAF